ncbi:MAG: hypothetical protein ACJ77A_11190 [Actinomycetota bacterium]
MVGRLRFVIVKGVRPGDKEAIRHISEPYSWLLVQGLMQGPGYVVYSAGGFESEQEARREVATFKQWIMEARIKPGVRDIEQFPP